MLVGVPGVDYGGISRRDDWSASGRSEYQMGIERVEGVPATKRRGGGPVTHMRQWLLLPDGVDPGTWTREAIWDAAGKAETRHDAREGRFFDITWPRELPTDSIERFVGDLYAPLLKLGVVVQADWETSPAEDGQPNDHIHGLISTRILSNDGFSAGKCRALDVWFRAGVRRHVASLFDAIAETCDLDVRFDPRSNVERDDRLPPEDRLPRNILRKHPAPGASRMLARRDEQRRLRHEHEAIKLRIPALQEERRSLLVRIEVDLADAAVLTSSQHKGGELAPLSIESAMRALMGRGVAIDRQMMVADVGLVLIMGRTTMVDRGDRILIDGPIDFDAVRAIHVLIRCKGWRDLSLTDPSGMPIPVPVDPVRPQVTNEIGSVRRSWLRRPGVHDAIRAADEVVKSLGTASLQERHIMLDRVVGWGNLRLGRLVARLAAHAGEPPLGPLASESVVQMLDDAMSGESNLWRRHVLEQDLVAMTVPGNRLSRPFRPHPRFYEYYDMEAGAGPTHFGGEEETVR